MRNQPNGHHRIPEYLAAAVVLLALILFGAVDAILEGWISEFRTINVINLVKTIEIITLVLLGHTLFFLSNTKEKMHYRLLILGILAVVSLEVTALFMRQATVVYFLETLGSFLLLLSLLLASLAGWERTTTKGLRVLSVMGISAIFILFMILVVIRVGNLYEGEVSGIVDLSAKVLNVVLVAGLFLSQYRDDLVANRSGHDRMMVGTILFGGSLLFALRSTYYPQAVQLIQLLLIIAALVMYIVGYYELEVFRDKDGQQDAEAQIKMYVDRLNRVVQNKTREVRRANEKLLKEIENAKMIQQSLLPSHYLAYDHARFYSDYYPCERLSGDFYDIYKIDEEHIGMYLLDVSGHGISAALMTMFTANNITSSERLIKRYRGLKPHKNLDHFYEVFNQSNFPDEMHLVVLIASYNTRTGLLKYASGGMNCHPILIRKTGKLELLDQSRGFPIMKFGEYFVPEYTSVTVQLEAGDKVLFYTDGLIDVEKNELFDLDELMQFSKKFADQPAQDYFDALQRLVDSKKEKLDDDVTFFIMEV